jgi:hypothetical protein
VAPVIQGITATRPVMTRARFGMINLDGHYVMLAKAYTNAAGLSTMIPRTGGGWGRPGQKREVPGRQAAPALYLKGSTLLHGPILHLKA